VTTVHFVYPHRSRIKAPSAIGVKVGERLRRRGYEVVHYNIDEVKTIRPHPGDVLLGHPHESPWSVFRRSVSCAGWRRRIMLMPYVHVDEYHVALADQILRKCDVFLAITGSTWFEGVPESITAHWAPKMVHVDLAVDRADFPRIKGSFNPPGSRRFLYIGHTGWYKNTDYLSELAGHLPDYEIAWIGSGDRPIHGLTAYGSRNFEEDEAKSLVAEHDFLLTVGLGDANPTTILEAMAWGLVPVCTPQSGYANRAGIVNVPAHDSVAAAAVLRQLQSASESRLEEMRTANDHELDAHFHWDRFTDQVVEAIESDERPALLPVSRGRAAHLRWLSAKAQASAFGRRRARATAREVVAASATGRRLLRGYRRLRRRPVASGDA
jgi:glycosyltransferase involved in cell wall biosynthesis